ncbi:MAG: lamin tail domain-containing protein [Fibrobacter sp.]|nr:lamin tail domain-containing protein [Fibrobacter sp.]
MSPIKTKHANIATAFLCALALWNCSSDTHETSATISKSGTASVALRLQYNTPPLLDSLVLDCYGADTLHYVHSADSALFNMDLFPSDNWTFKAKIYANGALMQMGELSTKLEAGAIVDIPIQMHPIVGFVVVEVPIGLRNESGIESGTMTLVSEDERYEIPMEESTGKLLFKSGMLKLGVEYEVQISLFDADGNAIYDLSDRFLLTEDSPVPDLSLNSLRSKIAVSVKPADERNVSITLALRAAFRKPKVDDLLITEYYAAPNAKDSTQYEFVEIYNGSIDTLILDDCTLGLGSATSIKRYALTASEILPGQVLVLGDAASENTPALHINTDGWSAMSNSKGAVVLQCDGETLDSLYYASAPDSLHSNVVPAVGSGKYNQSGQLNVDHWNMRSDSSAWCLTTPTPGELNFCN